MLFKLIPLFEIGCDRAVKYVNEAQARRLIRNGQARWTNNLREGLRLAAHFDVGVIAGRTHTSRGGVLAAAGLSQEYTLSERSKVMDYKFLAPEDYPIFHQATLGETI